MKLRRIGQQEKNVRKVWGKLVKMVGEETGLEEGRSEIYCKK